MCNDDANKQIGVVNNSGGCGIPSDLSVSRSLTVEADKLRPVLIRISGDRNAAWRNHNQLVVVFIKVDCQWDVQGKAGNEIEFEQDSFVNSLR